jgi:hypothetical protein
MCGTSFDPDILFRWENKLKIVFFFWGQNWVSILRITREIRQIAHAPDMSQDWVNEDTKIKEKKSFGLSSHFVTMDGFNQDIKIVTACGEI